MPRTKLSWRKMKDRPTRACYSRMAEAWLALAKEQEWLEGQVSPLPCSLNRRGA
jgi:hypothetical protein